VEVPFSLPGQFWTFLDDFLDRKRTTWIWAHNLGFDLTIARFWDEMDAERYTVQEPTMRIAERAHKPGERRKLDGFFSTADGARILKLWHHTGSRATFLDSSNFWKCRLADIGEAVGLPKMPMPPWDAPNDEWAAYCANDCRVLERAVLSLLLWVRRNQLGNLRYTAPAQSMSAYRHRFMSHPVLLHDNKDARKLERAAYYNGRVEAFYRGRVCDAGPEEWWDGADQSERNTPRLDPPVYHLDCTALYPSIMQTNKFPCRLLTIMDAGADTRALLNVPLSDCIARVRIRPGREQPVRVPGRGTIYCLGSFWTTLAGPELAVADAKGWIKEFGAVCQYQTAALFTDYMTWLWSARQSHERNDEMPWADLCKLMGAAFYGKFAQRTPVWADRPDIHYTERWGLFPVTLYPDQSGYAEAALARAERDEDFVRGEPLTTNHRVIAGHVQEELTRIDADQSFIAISAFVTSYGRVLMDRYRRVAGQFNTYYQGVDSLHVNARGFQRLVASESVAEREPGKLRLLDTYTHVRYWGPMDYRSERGIVRAGLKPGAIPVASQTWEQPTFQSLDRVLQEKPTGAIYQATQKVTHRPTHRSGTVTDLGWLEPEVNSR
jgi:hypothetical protein